MVKENGAYVDEVSVRRRWRGRGLARALLLELFTELRRRGVLRVHLHVDSANPTGAMRLYGSVGMTAEPGAHPFFEKDVPAG
jgi:ribosomal protein S18 acetylase RimI-like enzyme